MTFSTVVHHAGLALAAVALFDAGLRVASWAAPRGLARIVAAVVLAAGLAVAEALALGLVAIGGSSIALLVAAVVTAGAARVWLPDPAVSMRPEFVRFWRGLGTPAALGLGAAGGLWAAWTAWLFLHPALGRDMSLYHLPEAVGWVQNGRPGSILQIISSVPVGTYPVTHEVLLEWGLAIGRSFVWATLVTAAMPALAVAAAWLGLRSLRVDRLVAGLAGAALIATPAVIASQSGGASLDPAALAWLVSCAALCACSRSHPGLIAPAVVAAALAIGTKTTAAPLAVTALVIAAVVSRRRLRSLLPALGGAAALAVVVGGVWYLRNLFDHGWPLWPFSSSPWGDPRPAIIAAADVRFIDDPGETISRLHSYYWQHFGGALLLLAGAVAAVLVARSRAVVAATVAAALSVLLWMNAPFTGVLSTNAFDVGTGDATRYLMPGVAAATLAVALSSRAGRAGRWFAVALLAAALAVGLRDTFHLGFPAAPAVTTPLAGAALGALAVAALRRLAVAAPSGLALGAASLVVVAIAGAAAADGYVKRHGDTHTRESRVAAWFATQSAWRDGDAPVASTWSLIGPLAGDRLQHPLVLVAARDACRRAAASPGGWLVLDLHEQQFERARPCPGGPSYTDGDFAAYDPSRLRLARLAAP